MCNTSITDHDPRAKNFRCFPGILLAEPLYRHLLLNRCDPWGGFSAAGFSSFSLTNFPSASFQDHKSTVVVLQHLLVEPTAPLALQGPSVLESGSLRRLDQVTRRNILPTAQPLSRQMVVRPTDMGLCFYHRADSSPGISFKYCN